MSNLWFTADLHLGHENILKYEPARSHFGSIQEHDEWIIDTWNSMVRPKDVAWILGDVLWHTGSVALLMRLNGRKRLVQGNHDSIAINPFFEQVYGVMPFRRRTILSHIPLHRACVTERWNVNIHGHLHSKMVEHPPSLWRGMILPAIPDERYLCVSLEQNKLKPFNWDEIKEIMRSRGFKHNELMAA
jgi:calcineurin-like phosphoesterase family protein